MKSKKVLLISVVMALLASSAYADDSTVAYLWPTPSGSDHKQGVFTGVSLRGDNRKTFTLELWFNPLSEWADSYLIAQFNGNAGRTIFMWSRSTHKLAIWMGGYTGADMSSVGELPLNTWSHVAWVVDNDTWRLYINGELDSESTGHASHLMCENELVIGNTWTGNYNGNSVGYDAEARAWKCVRTGAQIKEWMGKRIANPLSEPDLVGYWPLADGDTATDAMGVRVRNYTVPGSTTFTGSFGGNFYAATGNYMVWTNSAAANGGPLPVTGTLPADETAIYNLGIHKSVAADVGDWTNAVNTGVTATPENFTFMGWYLTEASSAGRNNLLCGKMVYANGRTQFFENNGNLVLWMGGGINGATNESITATGAMPFRRWTHVALVKRGGTVQIYTNGVVAAESDGFALNLCNAELHLGGYQSANAWGGLYGAMKNVGFWAKAMGPENIRKHMYALPDPNDAKLLGYWPMDEGSGNTVRNLKPGAPAGVPLGNGFFYWTKGANMPTVAGTVKKDGMTITFK